MAYQPDAGRQKYSGEVNLDHPVIDERPYGIYLYFHDLPPCCPGTPSATRCHRPTTNRRQINISVRGKFSRSFDLPA
ncbi:MAG: hypothetical protein IJV05_09835 [Muribaculaceae bacterium]|nr:hypothetical protein [Muribaculaceae bacterium]